MYNSVTEDTIKQIPSIGSIDINRLPQELTRIYAEIISIRRNISDSSSINDSEFLDSILMLRALANNLETLVVNIPELESKRSIAFVSGTARYLLFQIRRNFASTESSILFGKDEIPEVLSAILLFLIGNSPADAAEVSRFSGSMPDETTVTGSLMKAAVHLAKGELFQILNLSFSKVNYTVEESEQEAVDFLWENLFNGIKQLASVLLDNNVSDNQNNYFEKVMSLAVFTPSNNYFNADSSYAGPYHLARLLNILGDDLLMRGVVKVPPPLNVDGDAWKVFLKRIAQNRPYLWENHYDAIETKFLNSGSSAVLTFPTGAGKSTLAELKIASTLLSGKGVIYLVPTHALEDQVNANLKSIFVDLIPDLPMEFDLEYTDLEEEDFPPITVMTPERCLTLISVRPENFSEIGLVVFDEFHLVHGKEDKHDKRSLDAMFCLLRLFSEIPNSDYLLISAMVENGKEISEWIKQVTQRPCISFDSNWKPTRQLHSCLMFQDKEINRLKSILIKGRPNAVTKYPNKAVKDQLKALPFTFFSLKNKWDSKSSSDYYINQILNKEVSLSASNTWKLTSNRNEVAADFASYFAKQNIKTLVFVDTPIVAKSTAKRISDIIEPSIVEYSDFVLQYPQFFDAIKSELGDLKHSFISDGKTAMHHGNMLSLERRLNENYYKKANGINVLVATATLAQGINLPAEVVIIAGDDRFDEDTGYRESIDPHEILNAAGRAGRAGSAAQGMVLLIPGEIINFEDNVVSSKWWKLKEEVFSNSDQCLVINDPLTNFLDTLSSDSQKLTAEQKNIIFRLNLVPDLENSINTIFKKSFGNFRAVNNNTEDKFAAKINKLFTLRSSIDSEVVNADWVDRVSLKMGLDPEFIIEIGDAIDNIGLKVLSESSIVEIVYHVMAWLGGEKERIFTFFTGKNIEFQLAKVFGIKEKDMTKELIFSKLDRLTPIIIEYLNGADYSKIELLISGVETDKLPKARNFCLKLIPNLSFIFGVFALVIREQFIDIDESTDEIPYVLKAMASFIREGLDTEDKLKFKNRHPYLLRTQVHKVFFDSKDLL